MTLAPLDGPGTGTRTALHAPRASLCSCIRAYVTRSTMDAPLLSAAQRENHFSAASICSVVWYVQGEGRLIRMGDNELDTAMPGPVVFTGPRTEPSVSYNPARVDLFYLILLPEAMHALTGVDIGAYTDRCTAFDQVFDAEWQAMVREVLVAPDHARRIELIEAFFEPRWIAAKKRDGLRMRWLHDYLSGMAVRFIASEWGRSVRQLERRVKTWTGLSLQRLHKMRRAEQRYLAARDAMRAGDPSWAEVAADTGYADQAHFCRETREASGLTPAELRRRVMHEESYWMYRIWS